jgi:hypothetical protein
MENHSRYKGGITLIEILLFLSILLILSSWFFRIFYANEIREWDDSIYKLIGVDPDFARFVIGGAVLIAIPIVAISRRRAQRRKRFLD